MTIAAGWLTGVVVQLVAPVVLSKAMTFAPAPRPCVPTTTLPSAMAGVLRALSPGVPVAAAMLERQRWAPVSLSTAYRFPDQSGK